VFFGSATGAMAQAGRDSVAQQVDDAMGPVAKWLEMVIFVRIPVGGGQEIPVVLIILAGTALFLTLFFGFINLRAFGLALKTVRGKYSTPDSPGQITHFQALSTALSATVGLGNIAGVALAIGIGGPGAVLWMILLGFLGMTSKFTECTLGVRYRQIDENGEVHGGGMFYLRDGLRERGFGDLGLVLAGIFSIACIGGALGAGNMFQVNQSHQQIAETFGIFKGDDQSWKYGLIVATMVGLVIIGGIVWIARVTEVLVPFMCVIYVLGCLTVLITHLSEVPAAFVTIVREAFAPSPAVGGLVGALIQGIQRGVFSNEAGIGSAAIAHSVVKTTKPASEGVVALLEPFVDTVVVCTMTALVIVVTGMWKVNADVKAESLPVLVQPVEGAAETARFEHGALLKVTGKWREVTVEDGGRRGWVDADAVTILEGEPGVLVANDELALLAEPHPGAAEVATVPLDGRVASGPIWAEVLNPEDETGGWAALDGLTERDGTSGGIWLTSQAFKGVIGWFPKVLAVAVFLFAFSTMISWSYYGEQALGFLTKENHIVALVYKVFFCGCVILGAAASLDNVLAISDSLFFAMVVPNMIGLYILLPVVRRELKAFREHAREIDAGES